MDSKPWDRLLIFWRKKFKLPILAITGSNGKTTTRSMVGTLLSQKFKVHEPRENFNNLVGLPLTLLELNEQHDIAVLELGMNHFGEITRLTRIADPTHALITNVGPVHLEGLKSVDQVARAKGELFQNLNSKAMAFINKDDPFCLSLAQQAGIEPKRQVSFGWKKAGDVCILSVKNKGIDGSEVKVNDRRKESSNPFLVYNPLPGDHNVHNLLAAITMAMELGLTPDEIVAQAKKIKSVGSRSRIVSLPNGIHLLDDCYNANPTSVKAALSLLQSLKGEQGTSIAILGEMLELGEQAPISHREIGQWAAKTGLHELFCVGEHSNQMAEGAKAQGLNPAHIHHLYEGNKGRPPDDLLEKIVAKIITQYSRQSDTWVLIKGSRGMALERVVNGLRNRMNP